MEKRRIQEKRVEGKRWAEDGRIKKDEKTEEKRREEKGRY